MRSNPGASRRAPALLVGVLLVTALLALACGIRPQDRAEPVTTAAPEMTESDTQSRSSGPRLTVFFVQGAALVAVERRTSAATPAASLDLLVEGPTRAEVSSGLRTALAPEVVGVDHELPGGLTTVAVTRGFAGLAGGNQLLAVAQVVWTLTQFPTVTAVRFTVDGAPVEVPTDDGLTDRPVDRHDYRSLTPPEPTPSQAAPEDSAPAGSPAPR